ncbi:hypothetical protein FRC08_002760 [Ceratobasidium sp. 394]|nr:hypothetical protein FRC08_002760 [Ceratobasidium sp. 394]KAG9092300.1 hypothetical protein FS749_015855 [Ceratobasidium sp. UAMH 11750]
MSTARPPLSRGVTAPGALYTYRPNERSVPEGAYAGGHCRSYGSVDATSSKPHSRYPTPPHTTSPPHSNASTPDSSDEDIHRPTAPQPAGDTSYFPHMSTPRSPVTSTPQVPIVAIRGSRSPTEDQRAQPDIHVSPDAYSMVAHIGTGFDPECITISAMKGNTLVIVADRWDMEKDCRYEWLWRFDRDANMSSVHAHYEGGVLRVTVGRIGYRLGDTC